MSNKTNLSDSQKYHFKSPPGYTFHTAQKMKFSIKYIFSKCDQIRSWSHLLKKSLMENFIVCAVSSG